MLKDGPYYYREGKTIKRIRPWALIITLSYFLIIATLDGNWGDFQVRDIYLKILEGVLLAMIAFLYGSRGAEKISQIIVNKKDFVPPKDKTDYTIEKGALSEEMPEIPGPRVYPKDL